MSLRNPIPVRRHFGLTSGQWHYLGGLGAMAGCALLVFYVLALLIAAGSSSCPADTGRVPARTLDGRTVCVVPGDAR